VAPVRQRHRLEASLLTRLLTNGASRTASSVHATDALPVLSLLRSTVARETSRLGRR
jgi:hypothetical protein